MAISADYFARTRNTTNGTRLSFIRLLAENGAELQFSKRTQLRAVLMCGREPAKLLRPNRFTGSPLRAKESTLAFHCYLCQPCRNFQSRIDRAA